MKVALKDGKIAMTFNGITTPFEHWHYDVFNGLKAEDPVFEDEKLQFGSGLDGEVDSVQIALEPSVKPIVFTKKADARLTDPAFLRRFSGTYALRSDMDATFSIRGSVLVADIKGQPTYELVPVRGTRFAIKGLTGFFVQFKDDASAVDFDQPNGIFTAKRK
jgi:hypothetical protein